MKQYNDYVQKMRKIADVSFAISVLQWDKEVNLPKKGAKFRSQQVATLSGISHELFTSKELGDLLNRLSQSDDLTKKQAKNVALTLKQYNRALSYSKEFVVRRSQTIAKAYHSWIAAREANDFNVFKKDLQAIVDLKKEEAELLGYKKHPYDALINLYEPDTTTEMLDVLFADVRRQLVDFVKEIRSKAPVQDDFLHQHYDKDQQWEYSLHLLRKMGYDFEAGRQDLSTHPFSVNFNAKDVRVTTRIDENNLAYITWSTIHEGGHALYEQGLDESEYGLPLGKYISLGIHESQSRLWENNVGRSLDYWQAEYSNLLTYFPEQLKNTTLTDFYKGINKVAPNLIRTESDELHYHFHVLVRYEIEKGLMEGSIAVDDLRDIWNQRYKEYLGVDVPDDKQGVLQDIHWAHGSIGYFPTYSLGSFYAAQFFHQAHQEMPTLKNDIQNGDSSQLLAWLREKIHRHGQLFTAEELCKEITGEPLNFKYFMDYVKEKYKGIYG